MDRRGGLYNGFFSSSRRLLRLPLAFLWPAFALPLLLSRRLTSLGRRDSYDQHGTVNRAYSFAFRAIRRENRYRGYESNRALHSEKQRENRSYANVAGLTGITAMAVREISQGTRFEMLVAGIENQLRAVRAWYAIFFLAYLGQRTNLGNLFAQKFSGRLVSKARMR